MDAPTFIVEGSTLINRIHSLKQWIYDGSIQIIVPSCASEEVERQYHASLVLKDAPKEPAAKRASGRAPKREEQPLFDINPRTAWEFLCRKRIETQGALIGFQGQDEEFSQWNQDHKGLENQPSNPVNTNLSFADALLRKLNITGNPAAVDWHDQSQLEPGLNDSGPKSPGKRHRVPSIPYEGVPINLKPFFSYVLWRIYESEDNFPTQKRKYYVLADGSRIKNVAAMLGIQSSTWTEIRRLILDRIHAQDRRSSFGQLERDFPALRHRSQGSTIPTTTQHSALLESEQVIPERGGNESSAGISTQVERRVVEEAPSFSKTSSKADVPVITYAQTSLEPSNNSESPPPQAFSEDAIPSTILLHELNSRSEQPKPHPKASVKTDLEGSELDSDEEIIVFNPRSKRMSGRPHTPAASSDPSQSRPATANGAQQASTDSPKLTKSSIKSILKAESPSFTPGQLYKNVTTLAQSGQNESLATTTDGLSPTPVGSPARSPRSPHAKPGHVKHSSVNSRSTHQQTDEERRQQSEIIIRKQRDFFERQAKASPKPEVRTVRKEPTDNPTIIDPDAFDRSYVVQPPSKHVDQGSRKRGAPKRGRGPRGQTPGHGHTSQEPEEEFVLKSGAPRGSSRGGRKLFVP